ncbi:MAG: efflux RND transporter periplasmic adaptor subunit [Lachnospiraceae bacterium]|nr:efflux RND transporter periplasmic adaptor subunit [Lachnospiraceae bacterium]
MFYGNNLKKKWILGFLSALLVVTGAGPVQVKAEEPPKEKELVESTADMPQLITVERGKIREAEYYQGEINPSMEVLQFPRKGIFQEYKVVLGDTVKKGQVLAVTLPEYRQEIETVTEKIEALTKNHDDQMESYELKMYTNEWEVNRLRKWIESMKPEMPGFDDICIAFELTMAEGRKIDLEKKQFMETSEKEIAFWQAKLERLESKNKTNIITAPRDGIITYLADLKVGDPVSVNSYPIVLADTSKCLVQCEYISVLDMEEVEFAYGVKDGKNYELTYLPYEAGVYERKVAKGEGVYTFYEVTNPDESIAFGEDIVVVTVTENKEDILIIPTECIHNDIGRDYVYCDKNGHKEAVFIEIGIADERNTEVLSGLKEGDVVYASN